MTTQQQPRPMLTHLGIHVRDLDRMVGFYSRVLGLTITDRGRGINLKQDMVFMSSSPSIHHQLLLCTGRLGEDAYNHINQISFNVSSLEEMQEIARRLGNESIPLRMQLDHGNAWSIYFHDPEGNTVEVYADSPWHVPQPYGQVFDISRPADEIRAATYEHSKGRAGFMLRTQYEEQMKSRMGPSGT
jgi:catechol 2,3-dioxygenase